jgi:hypothetical protein
MVSVGAIIEGFILAIYLRLFYQFWGWIFPGITNLHNWFSNRRYNSRLYFILVALEGTINGALMGVACAIICTY